MKNLVLNQEHGDGWAIYNADCVDVVSGLPDNSVHFSVYSPPFESLYVYSNSDRDMGNSANPEMFWAHYKFLIAEMFRVLKPGRLVSIHCMDLPTSKSMHGFIGLRDFPGEIVRTHVEAGFIYHSRVCIWKDPVIAMQRTKAIGLLHKQLKKDSALSRQGIADYVITLRKPGVNDERVSHTNESFPVDVWQRYASPVWMDINPSDTLQHREARENEDEKHIAPLQLEVIRRCIELWSNPKDIVLSPFTGIGSEGYTAVKMGRRFIGAELKRSYFDLAVKNMRDADASQHDLFAFEEAVNA